MGYELEVRQYSHPVVTSLPVTALTLLITMMIYPAAAQDQPTASPSTRVEDAMSDGGPPDYPLLLDGTPSSSGDLEQDNAGNRSLFRLPTMMEPWFAWKQ